MDVKKRAITRLIIAAIAMLNAILTAAGINPIPFDETLVTKWISYAFDGAMLIWVWWKDAPITEAGITGHDVMRAVRILAKQGAECAEELSNGKGEDNE